MYQLVIVDDEDKIVEGIANLFPWEQLGFQVTWFSRPLKALEYVRQHKVDVLMSDIEMPEMNGLCPADSCRTQTLKSCLSAVIRIMNIFGMRSNTEWKTIC